jgi:hypothetical protein
LEYLIANKRQQGTLGSHVRAAVERHGRRASRRQIAAAKQFTHWVRPPATADRHAEKGHKKGAECALFAPSMVSKEFA